MQWEMRYLSVYKRRKGRVKNEWMVNECKLNVKGSDQ